MFPSNHYLPDLYTGTGDRLSSVWGGTKQEDQWDSLPTFYGHKQSRWGIQIIYFGRTNGSPVVKHPHAPLHLITPYFLPIRNLSNHSFQFHRVLPKISASIIFLSVYFQGCFRTLWSFWCPYSLVLQAAVQLFCL